jgi:CBS domain-containing protein
VNPSPPKRRYKVISFLCVLELTHVNTLLGRLRRTQVNWFAAAVLLLRTTQQEFPIVDGAGALRGVVTREALIAALATTGGTTSVLYIMAKDIPSVPETSALESVMKILARNVHPAVAVVDQQGRLTGYVNAQNLAEFFWVRSAQSNPVS